MSPSKAQVNEVKKNTCYER